jgi:hypothetical protein
MNLRNSATIYQFNNLASLQFLYFYTFSKKLVLNKYFTALLFYFILATTKVFGGDPTDSTLSTFNISANYHYGFIIAHRSSIVPLQQDHTKSFELSIEKNTDGNRIWQQLYHYPTIGLKYLYIDLGNPQQLGIGQALIPFIDLRIYNNKTLQFTFNFGWGIGYIEKPFNKDYNYKDIAIGSHWNSSLDFSADLKFNLSKRSFLNTGLSLTHFSNGSVTTPNLGINVASVKIGITQAFGDARPIKKDSLPLFEKKSRNTFYIAYGTKQIYPVYGPNYNVYIFSATHLKQVNLKKAIGYGMDIHYDASLVQKLKNDSTLTNGNSDGIRAGINGTYEFIFSDFSITLQLGVYVYNKLKSDGAFYDRLGMRYQLSKNYFLCYNLKSHWAKADFFEFGIGMKL